MKKKINLVTTAIPEIYNSKYTNLYLGKWCGEEKNNKFIIQQYKKKDLIYVKDYKYLKDLNKRLFLIFFQFLNSYHRTNLSKKYWEIVFLPWLVNFNVNILDRWKMINKVVKEKKFTHTYSLNINKYDLIPLDFLNFYRNNVEDDIWNHYIFSKILLFLEPKKVIKKKFSYKKDSIKSYKKECFFNIYKNQKTFIKNTYLGVKKSLILSVLNFSLPIANEPVIQLNDKINKELRTKIKLKFKPKNTFERFLKSIILEQVPLVYLESFKSIRKNIKNICWPENPRIIFSSNILWNTKETMFYVAEKVETKKSKIFLMQHGGTYGQFKFNLAEDHETKIADEYFSWGWRNKLNKKITPYGINSKIKLNTLSSSKKKYVSIIAKSFKKYSLNNQSDLNYVNQISYLKNFEKIINKLNINFPKNTCIVRDYIIKKKGWKLDKTIKKYQNITYEDGSKNFNWYLKNSKIFICLNNSTTYLQLLSSNYPTLIFFDDDKNIYNKAAYIMLQKLKKVKIFHNNLDTLEKHLNDIYYKDIDTWWNSAKVQAAKNNFVKQYANHKFSISTLNKTLKIK